MLAWVFLCVVACALFLFAAPLGLLVQRVTEPARPLARATAVVLGSIGGAVLIATALSSGMMTEDILQGLSPDNPIRYVHCRAFADGNLLVTFVISNTEAEPLIVDSAHPLVYLYGGFHRPIIVRLPGEETSSPLALVVASGQTRAVTVVAADTAYVRRYLSHAQAGCDCSVGYYWESQVHGTLELPPSPSTF